VGELTELQPTLIPGSQKTFRNQLQLVYAPIKIAQLHQSWNFIIWSSKHTQILFTGYKLQVTFSKFSIMRTFTSESYCFILPASLMSHELFPELIFILSMNSNLLRLPNHMCASSCPITMATRILFTVELMPRSYSRFTSRKVTRPQCSIAPDTKSGMAARSVHSGTQSWRLLCTLRPNGILQAL
jgi:hypothetical protein